MTFQEVEIVVARDLSFLRRSCANCFRSFFNVVRNCFRSFFTFFNAAFDCSNFVSVDARAACSEWTSSSKTTDWLAKVWAISRQSFSRKPGSAITPHQCARSSARSLSVRCGRR